MGSSPRVRGSPLRQQIKNRSAGIIPAGAGLTDTKHIHHSHLRDHPRGCGAHDSCRLQSCMTMGSSPRVRGSLAFNHFSLAYHGIIPAGAGLTFCFASAVFLSWDHPRGCGAHVYDTDAERAAGGSSPRVRGSPLSQKVLTFAPGIIPAGAGLTSATCPLVLYIWDHPRGCGAHI